MNEELRIPGEPVSPEDPDIVWDLAGYAMNKKYPPTDLELYSGDHGYHNTNRETLFYLFAVQGYDLRIVYKGKEYFFLTEPGYVAHCDEKYTIEYERYPTGNTLLENFKIDGRSLVELVDELDEVEHG